MGGVEQEKARPASSYGPAVPEAIRKDEAGDPCQAPCLPWGGGAGG